MIDRYRQKENRTTAFDQSRSAELTESRNFNPEYALLKKKEYELYSIQNRLTSKEVECLTLTDQVKKLTAQYETMNKPSYLRPTNENLIPKSSAAKENIFMNFSSERNEFLRRSGLEDHLRTMVESNKSLLKTLGTIDATIDNERLTIVNGIKNLCLKNQNSNIGDIT